MAFKKTTFIAALAFGVLLSRPSPAAASSWDSSDSNNPLETNSNRTNIDWSKPMDRFRGDWRLGAAGGSFDEGKDQGVTTSILFSSRMSYDMSPWISIKVAPRIQFYSSRVQERIKNDDYQSHVSLSTGYLSVHPVEELELRTGAVNQGFIDNDLLVSKHRSFPGAQLLLKASKNDRYKAGLTTEWTVPTSYSLDTMRDSEEPMPTFTATEMAGEWTGFESVRFGGRAGLYAWSKMPNKVAYDSALLGNTVPGEVAPGATFSYGFHGYFGGVKACWQINKSFDVSAKFDRVHNGGAPSDSADSQSWEIAPKYKSKDFDLTVKYGNFFNESDSTVAYYNSSSLGNNNRKGDRLEFKLALNKYNFSVYGRWTDARVINVDPYEQNLKIIELGVETEYVAF